MHILQTVLHFSDCSFCIAELDGVQVRTTSSFNQEQFQSETTVPSFIFFVTAPWQKRHFSFGNSVLPWTAEELASL